MLEETARSLVNVAMVYAKPQLQNSSPDSVKILSSVFEDFLYNKLSYEQAKFQLSSVLQTFEPLDMLSIVSKNLPPELSADDLHHFNSDTKRLLHPNSFPNIIEMLQTEWNNMEDELFETKKLLAQTQRELAQALYENDAAKRVIARLLTEKPVGSEPIPQPSQPVFDISKFLIDSATEAMSERRPSLKQMRAVSESAFSAMSGFHSQNFTLGDPTEFSAIEATFSDKVILGTLDGRIIAISPNDGHVLWQSKAASGPITSISSSTDKSQFLISSEDRTVATFSFSDPNTALLSYAAQDSVISAGWHTKSRHIFFAVKCGSWGIIDSTTNSVIYEFNSNASARRTSPYSFSSVAFHCDGCLLATCNDNLPGVQVWKTVPDQDKYEIEFQTKSPVKSLAFSSCGLFLAACYDGYASIWLLSNPGISATIETAGTKVLFDAPGYNLLIGGEQFVELYSVKSTKDSIQVEKGASIEAPTQMIAISDTSSSIVSVSGKTITSMSPL